jgi:hypothetical protein
VASRSGIATIEAIPPTTSLQYGTKRVNLEGLSDSGFVVPGGITLRRDYATHTVEDDPAPPIFRLRPDVGQRKHLETQRHCGPRPVQ